MKVALLSAFYPFRGGIAQFGAMLYRALENDHEVKAFTFTRQYPKILFPGSSQLVTEEDKVDEIPAIQTLDSIQPFTYGKTAKLIRQFEPEILINQYWMTFFGPSMGRVAKKVSSNTKKLAILHNVIPHEKRFFDGPANRYFLKQHDGFVVMSDAVQRDLLSIKPDAKFLRIDHPVYNHFGERLGREDALKSLGLSTDKKYLLFFGFIRQYKGLDLLLEALSRLDDSYEVLVAGEVYGSFDSYEEQIKSLGLEKRVHTFTKYISDDEVTRYFSAADVCMLPYKSATQSGITAISHHFDLPIIATDVGGLKESIRHMETGLIVEKPDPSLLSSSVREYFEGNHAEEFRKNIKKEKAENNWENFAEKVVEFVKSL